MTKVKICGLRRMEDVRYVNKAKPDYAGFIFWKKSKRYVSPQTAMALKFALDPDILTVGVFVNAEALEIVELVQAGIIDIIQLHGDEDVAYTKKLRELTTAPIIKAVRVKDESSFDGIKEFTCDYYLFDTYQPGQYGGTGTRFDLRLGDDKYIDKPYLVAGGLDADNVCEVLEGTKALGVDVSGGVETDGFKDEAKIAAFVKAVKG